MSLSRIRCPDCPERHFSTLLDAVQHVMSERGTSRYVQCCVQWCCKTVRDRRLRLHLRKSHKELCPWLCPACPAKFVGWNDLINHQGNGCPHRKLACPASVSLESMSKDIIGMHKAICDKNISQIFENLTVFLVLQSQRSAHFKSVLDDSLIAVDTTSLDQHKLYYCTVALIWHVAKVKSVSPEQTMGDVIPFLYNLA